VRVALLGPVVVDAGAGPVEVRGGRQQALLALLALHAGTVVASDRIVDELWGDGAPADPVNALQALVSRLRKLIGPGVLAARGSGYVLDVTPDSVDVLRFERLLDEGRHALAAGDPARASRAVADATALWRGPALAELGDHPFARAAVSRLAELRGAAVDTWADAELALGHHAKLVADLRAAVDEAPLREGGWVRLMLALYRSGRQADALRAYQDARTVLAEQLGVEPGPELRAMESAILAQAPALAPPTAASPLDPSPPTSTPRRPRTSFVGRGTELAAVERVLEEAPLATLVGPGGVGKTRLASEIAARHAGAGARVAFVDLAPVVSDDDVAEAVAVALGARDQAAFTGSSLDALQRLATHVSGGSVLVVFDNCEHVIDAAARAIEALIDASDGVRVLATSREGLGIPGERLCPLPPLDVDDGVALFVDRAGAVRPGFDPGSDELDAIAEVCRRLDGLPLAIELAAARTRALPVADIAARLDDRFRLLTGGARTALPRQQTLRAVVDWSHDLLSEEERHVLARLSVFVGGFCLDDAAQVVGGDKVEPEDVGDIVLRLVDKSLVTVDAEHESGTARFGLLQTLWHYAREQLAASGDAESVRERHARHLTELVEEVEPELRGPGQRRALDRLETEHDNLRAALEWAVESAARDVACRLVAGLGWFWYVRGYVAEGARWASTALELPGEIEHGVEVRALRHLALLGLFAGLSDLPAGIHAVEMARRLGTPDELAESLVVLAAMGPRSGDAAGAFAALDEAEAIAAGTGNRWLLGTVALLRSGLLSSAHDVAEANRVASVAVEHYRTQREDWGLSMALMTRATGLEAVGDYEAALADYTEARDAAARLGSDELVLHFQIHSGNLQTLSGDPAAGRRHHEEAVEAARRMGSASVLGMALNSLGIAARRQGDHAAAIAAHDEARGLYGAGGWFAGASLALAGLGLATEQSGDPDTAEHHHRDALDLALRIADERAIALACEGLAGVAAARGDHARAATLLGHAAGRRARVGAPLPPGERFDVDRIEAATVDALGRARYDDLSSAGTAVELQSLLSG
jgi:predicted ATPase/DNA-binding SARP family transcriptional activator